MSMSSEHAKQSMVVSVQVVVLDGKAYHQDEAGSSTPLDGSQFSPFMSLCTFNEHRAVKADLPAAADMEALLAAVKEKLRSENLIYAVHIRGGWHRAMQVSPVT